MTAELFSQLNQKERQTLSDLDTPVKIQAYLDDTPYSPEERNRCVISVIRDRMAHCLDGGLFAVSALRRLGYPPLLVDLYPQPYLDDDHVLALFKVGKFWGSVAKSNYVGLRYRAPVYRSLRELVMSYFNDFYNVDGLLTLRGYSRPIDLSRFDAFDWESRDSGVDRIEAYLKERPMIEVISADGLAALPPVDSLTYRAGMLVANPDGLYKPKY
jgi:hypothetical protein